MKPAQEIKNEADEVNSSFADWVESTLPQSLVAKYEGTFLRLQEAFRDIRTKHLEFLELQSRQSEEDRVLNPIPPVIFWLRHKGAQPADDKSSTPEPLP